MNRPTRGTRARLRTTLGAVLALVTAGALAACGAESSAGDASSFPAKPLTLIAAGDPGGGLDTAARLLETGLEAAGVDQRMTIENNGGGGGNPARAAVLKRPNDGSTVVAESKRVFLNPLLGTTDMQADDFTAIAQLSNDYLVWAVRADSELDSATKILDAVKKDPSSITFGVGTVPSDDQINILKAAQAYGVSDLGQLNIVAFQSGGDLNTELLGGHVQVVSTGYSEAAELASSGKIKLLSISAPEEQGGAAEGVPTWKDLGLDFTVNHWRGVFGPADMPDYAVSWWQDEIEKATETSEWKDALEKQNLTSDFLPSDEFTQSIQEQSDDYRSLLTEVGLVS